MKYFNKYLYSAQRDIVDISKWAKSYTLNMDKLLSRPDDALGSNEPLEYGVRLSLKHVHDCFYDIESILKDVNDFLEINIKNTFDD